MQISPYLRDHHFEGRVILPAVEALIVMAGVVSDNFPQIDPRCQRNARFSRFLQIPPEVNGLSVIADIKNISASSVAVSLSTSARAKTSIISRTVEHACAEFGAADAEAGPAPSFRSVGKLEGKCINIPASAIYGELVPFGKAYQNIVGDLSLSDAGAVANISGGSTEVRGSILGSPFPLDAAMHAACVWGQRFTDIVPFPVGFSHRVIHRKTKKGASYIGRIMPIDIRRDPLIFDAWIFDINGIICESIKGLQMRDVTQGRLHPPAWIKEGV